MHTMLLVAASLSLVKARFPLTLAMVLGATQARARLVVCLFMHGVPRRPWQRGGVDGSLVPIAGVH